MYLVDTHTHIYLDAFDADLPDVMRRALEAGVVAFCLPGIDVQSLPRLKALCAHYPGRCFPMLGLHPTNVGPDYPKDLALLRAELDTSPSIGIGEIGVDLHWNSDYLHEQQAAFEEQLRWSIEKDLPVAIHMREAFPQVFDSLHKVGIDKLRGVFHSFGGHREELEEILRYPQFLLGINGVVTYKNTDIREYLTMAPLERLVLETDAPYLPPVPYRGKRNEPAYVALIAQKVAEVYGVPVEKVAAKTTENATKLWRLLLPPPA
ncbi:MAG: TatD family hydrolase [Dysgonamonadaceae bacterium]|jgi:TatD DNase family protein|nr:TatD family hydrolase [Dysgonamonadaceae bacterium]